MKDLNFFEIFNKKKTKRSNSDIIIYFSALILLICIFTYYIYNILKINNLTKEVGIFQEQLEIKKSDIRINQILEKEEELKLLQEQYEKINKMDIFLESNNIINEKLVPEISSRVPEDTFLSSIIINSNLISIEGIAKDKKSISDFQYRLSEIELFENVFVPSINQEGNHYNFNIYISPREVQESEYETENE